MGWAGICFAGVSVNVRGRLPLGWCGEPIERRVARPLLAGQQPMRSEGFESVAHCLWMEPADCRDGCDRRIRFAPACAPGQVAIDPEFLRAESVIVESRVNENDAGLAGVWRDWD